MKKRGFTLIELVAVIVLLGIILAIAVPTITGIVKNSTKNAFQSDAKLVLKGVDYKKLENAGFNPTSVNKNNIGELLGISPNNYENVTITVEEGIPIISIIGKDKWDGFIACGTYFDMRVVEDPSDCNVDSVPPVLTILGSNPLNMYVGEVYSDPGATAVDNISGDITDDIIVTGSINPNVPGTYTITYRVLDIFENETVATRTVNVIDNAYPMITFDPNGNTTYAKTESTTITATDLGILDNSSLKYAWSMNTVEPSIESFTNTYTSGDSISTPVGVTGSYYLWAEASDTAGNRTVLSSGVFNLDNTAPTIGMNGDAIVTVNKGSTYSDAGATATDNVDTSVTVTSTGSVNPSVVGSYTITYNATDSSGNSATPVTRTVNVVDVLAPVITLNGSNPTNINVNSTYTDAGATAVDDVDGDVTSRIVVTGTVNPSVVGSYTITYTVKDSANNTATATRTVNVIDNIAPTVVFGTNGNSTYAKTRSTTVTVSDNVSVNTSSLKYIWNTSTTSPSEATFTTTFTNGGTITSPSSVTGSYYLWILAKDNAGNTAIVKTNVFNLDNTIPVITMNGYNPVTVITGNSYVDAGATATDNIDGTISVTTSGSVNTSIAGAYTITYNVSDTVGNTAILTRTVNVIQSTYTYDYTSGVQTLVVPATGNYTLEVYGAQGGKSNGGKGGSSIGTAYLTHGQTLYIYVGGAGAPGPQPYGTYVWSGGWNGGGGCQCSSSEGTGGGGTDIRLNGMDLTNRIIVAGGGGGGGDSISGGSGGGLSGDSASYNSYRAYGGTQTAGGDIGGVLGSGGSAMGNSNGGGGGGYYGGGIISGINFAPGAGGSGYIGGVTSGSMQIGVRSGNGYAKVTYIGQ
jgi:prepilin-type N-terminal cleavage/methylation domain-containing protein